jgi:hypothetical protein
MIINHFNLIPIYSDGFFFHRLNKEKFRISEDKTIDFTKLKLII